jgi:signal transduction histidine kinase/DNA-binding response OmpR family regulator
VHLVVPYEVAKLYNLVNLASTAQNNFFKTADSSFEKERRNIWTQNIKSTADTLIQMKALLLDDDTLLIEKAISGLEDYEIAQDEMNLIWLDAKSANVTQKKAAENTLNERRLTLTAITQDDASAILIPLRNKYQAKANAEMDVIYSSTQQSNWTILMSIFFATILILLLLIRQRELVKAKRQAEIASSAKSEFLANMSHEIRTPLNGVIGFTDLLMNSKVNETQQHYLTTVSQSANSLLDIINDILDFSKIEAGKLELSNDKIDLLDLGGQITDLIKYQAHHKKLELLLNISSQVPRYIWSDEIRLRQILINLLSNAVKFTEFGEIELKIEALEKKANDEVIYRFSVRDTGIGIDPKNQQKVFDAFSQEDGSTTKRFGGTGLGLTISNKLLALMKSKLQLQSTPSQGSTFYFDVAFKSQYGQLSEFDDLTNIQNVLIVDDNANNRDILKDMLALKSIATDLAKSGNEALEKIKSGQKYDVIIMDYHMPYMDGIDTIRKINAALENAKKQPIILLYSSSDDNSINKACDELKVSQRLVKPVKINQLYQALAKATQTETNLFEKSEQDLLQNDQPDQTNHRYKVMIAEDNMVNMLLCKTFIKKIMGDVIIIEAHNGKQAVAYFNEQMPDLVFMDIQMPELNGYDTTMEIRKNKASAKVPIIALTAGAVKGEREKCLAAGMNDYITKPFVMDTMEKMIRTYLK